jgi:regulatory protein
MEPDAQILSRAKRQAYRFLAYRSQTSHELRDRLRRKGYTAAVVEKVLRELEAEGYVDDRKFALEWARYRLQSKPLGRRRLAWELQRRGLPSESVAEVLREVYSEFDEATLAERAMLTRLTSKDMLRSVRERQRCIRYLAGLGFEAETIAAVLGEIRSSILPLDLISNDETG